MRFSEIKKIAIDNDFDNDDLSGFRVYSYNQDFRNTNIHFGLNLGINRKDGSAFKGVFWCDLQLVKIPVFTALQPLKIEKSSQCIVLSSANRGEPQLMQ
jgi:hypothetical protein